MIGDGDEAFSTTPAGLLKCLRMLAEEAAAMCLPLTFAALQEALEACALESRVEPPADPDRRAPMLH